MNESEVELKVEEILRIHCAGNDVGLGDSESLPNVICTEGRGRSDIEYTSNQPSFVFVGSEGE